jgi:hypothetical protein
VPLRKKYSLYYILNARWTVLKWNIGLVLWSAYVSCETEQGRKLLKACLLIAVASRKNKKVSLYLVIALRIVTDKKYFRCVCVQNSLFMAAILGMQTHTSSCGRWCRSWKSLWVWKAVLRCLYEVLCPAMFVCLTARTNPPFFTAWIVKFYAGYLHLQLSRQFNVSHIGLWVMPIHKMETLPQILQLTSFRRYNAWLCELRQFYVVRSIRYSSVFTLSKNDYT